MLQDYEILEILSGIIENKNIDLKRGFIWKTKSPCTVKIIKHILAMSNTRDGGKLIIGFDEKQKDFFGDGENWFELFDQTTVYDSVNTFSSSEINLQVAKKANFSWNKKSGNLVIIEVGEFSKDPTIVTKDGTDSVQKTHFHSADILHRTAKATSEKIKDPLIMRDLLHRAAMKHKTEIIESSKTISEQTSIGTFSNDPTTQYLDEIVDFATAYHNTSNFPTFNDGVWHLEIMPMIKDPQLIALKDLRELVTESQSRHRGWPFPIITHELTKTESNFVRTVIPPDSLARNDECWRLYRDGLFCWTKSMFENDNVNYSGTLSKVNSIWNVTEILLFASRLYGRILSESDNLHIKLTLTNAHERRYHDESMGEYGNPIDTGGKCNTEIIDIERRIAVLNLEMHMEEEIHSIIEELDTHFDVRKYDSDYTIEMKKKLLDMHLIPPHY